MSVRDLVGLIVLGALWGASYVFIRIAVPALGPFVLMGLRVFLAASVLALYALAVGQASELGVRRRAGRFLLLGAVNAAAPFSLIAAAELYIPASLAAILNATTALFTALVAAAWLGDALNARKVVGLLLGMVGVTAVVGWTPIALSGAVLLSAGACLLAALCYALGGVYTKRSFSGVPPLSMAVGQQLGAGLLLLPLVGASLPGEPPSPGAALAVLSLALLSTALAYLIYFRLIASVGPTNTQTVTFLVPCFGLLFGVAFLGETAGAGTLVGFGIVLASVALVTGVRLVRIPRAVEALQDVATGDERRPLENGPSRWLSLWGATPIPFFAVYDGVEGEYEPEQEIPRQRGGRGPSRSVEGGYLTRGKPSY